MKKRMGTFNVECAVSSHIDRERKVKVPRMLADTGSELTWIAGAVLRKIGIMPEKRGVQLSLSDGRTVNRDVGFAFIYVAGRFTTDEIVFAKKEDLQVLGARTLAGLNLAIDPARKRLIAAGPILAAANEGIGTTKHLDKLAGEIRDLPDMEKLQLVDSILTDLDQPDPKIDQVWAKEARRRWAAYKAGRAPTFAYETIMAKYRNP